jgi:cyclopropane fatty-acyl-phospholipid synthase-like methyltransferase
LDDVRDSWEFALLPAKEVELPALQKNALDALNRIEQHLQNGSERKILDLDFGSGWGFFLATAKQQGWTSYGLEPLPASAVYARATFGLSIITDTLRDNTYPNDFFDVITAFQVFEHLPYPKKDIQSLYRMLKRGGIILIEVPNFETWTMRLMKSRHRHFVQDHLNFFSITTLGRLLTENGFELIDHYCPTRRMSIRHLVDIWLQRYLPAWIKDAFRNILQRVHLWNATVGLNLGDILTVIARKC